MSIIQALAAAMRGNPENRMGSYPPPGGHRPAQMMSPQALPSADRASLGIDAILGVGDNQVRAEMPGGPGKALLRAKLTPSEGGFFQDLGAADVKELKQFVPSAKAFGSRRDVSGAFDEVPTILEISAADKEALFRYLEETSMLESRAVGGPGRGTLPKTFSRPQLLLDRLKPHQ